MGSVDGIANEWTSERIFFFFKLDLHSLGALMSF